MKIAVVGGGPSGLTCAYRLQCAGHEVVVYESDAHVGGRMASVLADGFTIDTGVSLLLATYKRTQALAKELGIEDEWFAFHAAGSGGVLRDGKLTSFSPNGAMGVLGYRGLSWFSRVRLLLYFLRARKWVGKFDFFDLSVGSDALEAVDADTYVRSKLGPEIADWLFDPFVRTFHFHGAKRISMKYFDALAALLLEQGRFSSRGFRHNMGTLSHALASHLKVFRQTPVKAVYRQQGRVCVELLDRKEFFDSVVLATPATISRKLLQGHSPQQRELLDKVEYSSTLMCAFRVPKCALPDFEGIWVPFAESSIICCCANETRKGAVEGSECVLILGTHEEASANLFTRSDKEVFETVAAEWSRLFPQYESQMKGIHVQRWPNALPIYAPGLINQVTKFWQNGQGEGGIWLCGDYLNHPWVEGSIHCGEKVAARIGRAVLAGEVSPLKPKKQVLPARRSVTGS
ncbi:MAG: FAD-dependent oxidoreductase [Deltaproteobacteria bacterium]|nr:FAD-dependent oxidoreductase [Deltaproteobacteria bacterium]